MLMIDTMITDTLVVTSCATCGIKFGLPSSFYNARREDKDLRFHCPNGHRLHFGDPSKAEREATEAKRIAESLRTQLGDALSSRNKERHARMLAENRERRVKGKLKSAETRVHAGVCPYCNRTFQALARHMNTKHPKVG